MSENKQFTKKELNKDDYKKDVKIIGGIKKYGSAALSLLLLVGGALLKGKIDNDKKE